VTLHQLAAFAGVDVAYAGWRGEPVDARPEALIAVLAALGHDVRSPDDAEAALAAARRAWWDAGAPPVIVTWDAGAGTFPLRVRADRDDAWELVIRDEAGVAVTLRGRLFELPATDHADHDGAVWCARTVTIPASGLGYHDLRWRVGDADGHARWIAAPTRAHGAPGTDPKSWGVFAPLYALRTERSGGAGDLAELRRLAELVRGKGGRWVATLPLLAAFLDEPCEPSPYAPASRLAWNELYLDLERPSPPEAAALFRQSHVDYRAQYRWRRAILDELAAAAWAQPAHLEAYARLGEVADYAAFRALGEQHHAGWAAWPDALRDAPPPFAIDDILAGRTPVDPVRWRTHAYAQWAMDRQLASLSDGGSSLYLDLPVGVSRDAFEVWRHRDAFVLGAGVGAPPDALFLGGQGWGLPPLHPERIRARGWDHVIACVRHHMRHAGMLRIDHVMGLYRLYWVPDGFAATEGVYVRYAADELFAILCLESQRHACALVGEDLGTVPDAVPPAMRRHGLAGLHVAQFALPGHLGQPLGDAAGTQVACVNTHDTPTFAGWWRGHDIDDKLALGLITDEQAARERLERIVARPAVSAAAGEAAGIAGPAAAEAAAAVAAAGGASESETARAALLGVVRHMAAGAAPVVLVTLEDAWLEPEPQNVPGTSHERPNWRRPFSLGADAILHDPRVLALLDAAKR